MSPGQSFPRAIAVGAALLSSCAGKEIPASSAARSFQHDPTHSGWVRSGTLTPPLKRVWTSVSQNAYVTSFAIVADGKVFSVTEVNDTTASLNALDLGTGKAAWGPVTIPAAMGAGPAFDTGNLIIGTSKGQVFAFDPATGMQHWQTQLVAPTGSSDSLNHVSPPVMSNGTIYFGTDEYYGHMYGLNAKDGSPAFATRETTRRGYGPAAVDSTGIYMSSQFARLTKFTLDGAFAWALDYSNNNQGSSVAVLFDSRLYVRSGETGEIVATSGVPNIGTFKSTRLPAFREGVGFFVNTPGRTLTAIDQTSYKVLWTFSADLPLRSHAFVVQDFVYVQSASGKLFAVDAMTGKEAWSDDVPETSYSRYSNFEGGQQAYEYLGLASDGNTLIVPTGKGFIAYTSDMK